MIFSCFEKISSPLTLPFHAAEYEYDVQMMTMVTSGVRKSISDIMLTDCRACGFPSVHTCTLFKDKHKGKCPQIFNPMGESFKSHVGKSLNSFKLQCRQEPDRIGLYKWSQGFWIGFWTCLYPTKKFVRWLSWVWKKQQPSTIVSVCQSIFKASPKGLTRDGEGSVVPWAGTSRL